MRQHIFERFEKFSMPEPMSGCWLWLGALKENGYGVFSLKHGYPIYAHRFSYLVSKGDIVEGFEVDHICANRACVNPEHLQLLTHRANLLRSENTFAGRYARQTVCKHGHVMLNNVYVNSRGQRWCLTCRRAYDRKRESWPNRRKPTQ